MLLLRIYGLVWALAAAAGAALYFTDSFTLATTMALGFLVSVLAGAFLLVVYPSMMSQSLSAGRRAGRL